MTYQRDNRAVCGQPECQRPGGCWRTTHMFDTGSCVIHKCHAFIPMDEDKAREQRRVSLSPFLWWNQAHQYIQICRNRWEETLEAYPKLSPAQQVELSEALDKAYTALSKGKTILESVGGHVDLSGAPRRPESRNERAVKLAMERKSKTETKTEPRRVDEHGRAVPSLEDIR